MIHVVLRWTVAEAPYWSYARVVSVCLLGVLVLVVKLSPCVLSFDSLLSLFRLSPTLLDNKTALGSIVSMARILVVSG